MSYAMTAKQETEHSLQLAELLDSQRISGCGTDVILVCEGKDFPAHKIILSATSKYFRAMLTPGWEESSKGKIELQTVSAKEMEIILPFLYKGKINDVDDLCLLKTLLKTSHMLEINALFEYCCKNLLKGLSCHSFLEVFNLADLYNSEEMTSHIISFLARQFPVITTSKEFLQLNVTQLQKIVQHSDIYRSFMDDVVKGLIQWSEVEGGRVNSLLHILTTLDLGGLSTEFLMELLREQVLVKENIRIVTFLLTEATTRMLAASTLNFESGSNPKLLCFGKNDQRQVFRTYDIAQNKWLLPKTLPFHLERGSSTVWFGGYIYIVGGGDIDNPTPIAKIVKYSPSTNTIAFIGKLAIPAFLAGVGLLQDSIYIVNGVNEDGDVITTVQRYDPITRIVEVVAPTNSAHNCPNVLTFTNFMYVLGSGKDQNSIERYDVTSNSWTVITTIPGTIDWCSSAIFTEKLFVVPTETTNELQVYDFDSNSWSQKEIEGSPRKITGLYPTSIEGKCILLVCDHVGVLHSYDGESGQWIRKSDSNMEPWNHWQTCLV